MDQTTDTADLTETEKYLNLNSSATLVESDDDDESEEEEATDALLGGIRTGIRTITRRARETLSICKNKTELDNATDDIETSTLKLLKLEKSFMKTATLVSGVIDDMILDFEDDDDPGSNDGGENEASRSGDENGSGDASIAAAAQVRNEDPYVFRLSPTNMRCVGQFREKLAKELNKRMDDYKSSLSDAQLRTDKKFVALIDQVKLGRNDAENASTYANELNGNEKVPANWDTKEMRTCQVEDEVDVDEAGSTAAFLRSIPYSAEELQNYKYKPYDEEADTDDSVLPSVDPISKELIMVPVKNKFCHHVFERDSIFGYIACNPEAKCPVHMCDNKRTLEQSHFVTDSALTTRVKRKNNF